MALLVYGWVSEEHEERAGNFFCQGMQNVWGRNVTPSRWQQCWHSALTALCTYASTGTSSENKTLRPHESPLAQTLWLSLCFSFANISLLGQPWEEECHRKVEWCWKLVRVNVWWLMAKSDGPETLEPDPGGELCLQCKPCCKRVVLCYGAAWGGEKAGWLQDSVWH